MGTVITTITTILPFPTNQGRLLLLLLLMMMIILVIYVYIYMCILTRID